jgi:uncharacterized membrane protein YfhO
VAVTERPIAGLKQGAAGASSPGEAQIVDYREERVSVATHSDRAALLVLTDSWFPGWKAEVDGTDVPIERVDYLIRGVRIPAGRHRVEFKYEPASWRAGLIVSLLALLVIAGTTAVGLRRGRGGGP